MWDPPAEHALSKLFSGLTEHAFFTTLGVADPPLIDYCSGLLSRFVRADDFNPLKGRPDATLNELFFEANRLPETGRVRHDLFRHIGDVALFWTGLFPEALQRNPIAWGPHAVLNYTQCGKRSYLTASRCDAEDSELLLRLSEQFELCATGLREVRRDWEQMQVGS
jgi:hypothetical protein